ncbi:cytochrome b [Marinicella sp. W31]|uniref:cytochrome b n=1 Tax=Marinicella sp. W31 TaxID=3023713 RepID=UPI00375713C7
MNTTTHSYHLSLRLLHWLMAIIIFALFAVGWYMVQLDYYDPLYQLLPWWHKSFGITLMMLLVLRLFSRWRTHIPKPLENHTTLEKKASVVVKFLFYLLILLLGISGYLISTAQGEAISVFDVFEIPSMLALTPQQVDQVGFFHEILAWTTLALACVHAVAALKHHFIDKDQTLLRMIRKQNNKV